MLHTAIPALIEQISWLIPHLPPPRPITVRGEADYYGASHEIASAIGLSHAPSTAATWRHGWTRFPAVLPEMVATYKPGTRVHLMPDERHAKLLLDAGYTNAVAVGYPILYAAPSLLVRRPSTLLAAPFHLLPEITPHHEQRAYEQEYAAWLSSQRAHFDTVCACLHVSCVETGLWTTTLEQHGIPWVLGAMTADAHGLRRVRSLFEAFDCVVTNHIGSVMPYAAHFGARTCVAGPSPSLPSPETYASHPTYQRFPQALERLERLRDQPLAQDLPFLLANPANATCPRAWAEETLGTQHQLPHLDIARLLGWNLSAITETLPPDTRRRLLITLGWTPSALGDAVDREKLGQLLPQTPGQAAALVEAALKDRQHLQKELKAHAKTAAEAAQWKAFRQSWTWRLFAKLLFSLEKRLRPTTLPPQEPSPHD
jgi:hypothetical protein